MRPRSAAPRADRSLCLVALLAGLILTLVACSSGTSAGWSYPPVKASASASAGASGTTVASPAGSASPGASGSPGASASPGLRPHRPVRQLRRSRRQVPRRSTRHRSSWSRNRARTTAPSSASPCPCRATISPPVAHSGTSPSRSSAPPRRSSGPGSRSPAARVEWHRRGGQLHVRLRSRDHRQLRHRLPRPARRRPVEADRLPERDGRLLPDRRRPRRRDPVRCRGDERQDLRRRLHDRVEGGPGRPAVLLDPPGGRGPRVDPRVPRRRQARPVRRELRDAVRPDLRVRPSRRGSRHCSSTDRWT